MLYDIKLEKFKNTFKERMHVIALKEGIGIQCIWLQTEG